MPKNDIRSPETFAEKAIAAKGWTIANEGVQAFLYIDDHKVRYYPFPPEQYDLLARQMIIRNTRAELEVVLDHNYNPGSHLSVKELIKHKHDLFAHLDKLHEAAKPKQGERRVFSRKPHVREDAVLKVLAPVCLQLAFLQADDYLNRCNKGEAPASLAELHKEALDNLNGAVWCLKSTRSLIAGRAIKDRDYRYYHDIVMDVYSLLDLKKPISETIINWYQKMANNMCAIDECVNKLEEWATEIYHVEKETERLRHCAYDLLQARRNEPEYSIALAEFQAEREIIKTKITKTTPENLDGAMDWTKAEDKRLLRSEKRDLTKIIDDIAFIAKTREAPPSLKKTESYLDNPFI